MTAPDNPDRDLGVYEIGFASWSRILSNSASGDRLQNFRHCTAEVASYVARGLEKATAVDELIDLAASHGLTDEIGIENIEAIIGRAFTVNTFKSQPEPEPSKPNGAGEQQQQTKRAWLNPEPWWADPATIAKREMIYRQHYIRSYISATIGAGGRAKTTLGTYEAVSMTVGRDLASGEAIADGPFRVWVLNAEEDQAELDRRFAATCQHYNVTRADLGDRLFVQSVRGQPMRVATLIRNVPTLNREVLNFLHRVISDKQIDVFMLDPFISFHAVNESNNSDMDLVIKEGLGGIAEATNSAGAIFHHPGKPKPGQETSVEDGRGASAIIWAARDARVLNFMSPEEAKKLGIGEDTRRMHIRVANGKANMGPVGKADWIKIETENLANGDVVACATLWKPPNPFQGLNSSDVEVARKVAQGGCYRADSQSPLWFGYAIAPHLKINVKHGAINTDADLARLKTIIKTWLKNNVLAVVSREDEHRKPRKIIVPAYAADDTPSSFTDDDSLL
jgi:hypothetical protein